MIKYLFLSLLIGFLFIIGLGAYERHFIGIHGYGIADVINFDYSKEPNPCSVRYKGSIEIVSVDSDSSNNAERQIDDYRMYRLCQVVGGELQSLPDAVANVLKKIIFTKVFRSGDVIAAGTYDASEHSITIGSEDGDDDFYSDLFIRGTFHHELSSFIVHSSVFDVKTWRDLEPSGFEYPSAKDFFYTSKYLAGYIKIEPAEFYYQQGLVSDYGTTGVENDFNEYARLVFTEPARMTALIDQYPQIKKKYLYFKQVYLDFDKGFQPFFDKIDAG